MENFWDILWTIFEKKLLTDLLTWPTDILAE